VNGCGLRFKQTNRNMVQGGSKRDLAS